LKIQIYEILLKNAGDSKLMLCGVSDKIHFI